MMRKKKSFVEIVNDSRESGNSDLTSKIESILTKGREKRNFFDHFISREGQNIHKLKAKDSTGKWAYYYVLVRPSHERRFMAAISGKGMIDLESFGSVVASCYGEEPTEEIKQLLKDKYGFDV